VQALHLVGKATASISRGTVTTKCVPYSQSEANGALFIVVIRQTDVQWMGLHSSEV